MATTDSGRLTRADRALAAVERVGNRLPDPFVLFCGLYAVVAVASTVCAALGVTAQLPGADEPVVVRGLLTGEGLAWATTTLVENFVGFPPLGTVVVILLAVGLAERSGMLSALVRLCFARSPRWLLPYAVAFVGITGSVMADSAMLVIPPLAAMVFAAAGRHPVAGLVTGFAAAGAGYSTSPVVTSLDALFAGITAPIAETLPDPGTPVTPVSNWYFGIVCSVVLAGVAGLITDRVLEPRLVRLGVAREEVAQDDDEQAEQPEQAEQAGELTVELTADERRGLRRAGLVGLVVAAAVVTTALLPASPLRNDDGGYLPTSPLLDSTVFVVVALLALPALAFGRTTGSIATAADVPRLMGGAVRAMAPFIVLAFVLGQFIALFTWTGLGTVIADRGAALLDGVGLTGLPAIVGFIVLASLLNFLITSGSSMWTLMATVFVPLFGVLGYEPGFVQAAFRVGDSATQVLTPLNPYLVIVLAMLRRYEPEAGLGTVIARMLPYSAAFWLVWTALLLLFALTGLPFGPGQGVYLDSAPRG